MNNKDSKEEKRNSIKEYLATPTEERERDTGYLRFNIKDRTVTPIIRKFTPKKD